jgi:subtilisin family serine protease
MKKFVTLLISVLTVGHITGQERQVENLDQKYLNWYNQDIGLNKIMGTSTDKLYDSILHSIKPKKTVVVAVIDGGVDIYHEDLVGKIWVNQDEIANNNIDDDKNGYIDDVNGWNFIGNKAGENVNYENLEYTRVVKQANESDKNFQTAKNLYDSELQRRQQEMHNLANFEKAYQNAKSIILEKTGINIKTLQDLSRVYSDNYSVLNARDFLRDKYTHGFSEEQLEYLKKTNKEYLEYFLNKEFNARILVGDDPLNFQDRNYGNKDVKGPRADHGTSVAGLIAGIRNNGLVLS